MRFDLHDDEVRLANCDGLKLIRCRRAGAAIHEELFGACATKADLRDGATHTRGQKIELHIVIAGISARVLLEHETEIPNAAFNIEVERIRQWSIGPRVVTGANTFGDNAVAGRRKRESCRGEAHVILRKSVTVIGGGWCRCAGKRPGPAPAGAAIVSGEEI